MIRPTLLVLLAPLLAPAQTLLGTQDGLNAGDRFGSAVLWIEAFPDGHGSPVCPGIDALLSGAPEHASATGQVEMWTPGGLTGAGTRSVFATGNVPGDRFGAALAGPGDLNGDPWPADFVVGAPGALGGAGRVRAYVSYNPPSPPYSCPNMIPGWIVTGGLGDALGHAVAVVGDVNGDGCEDVLAGAPYDDNVTPFGTYTDAGRIHLLSGCDGLTIRSHAVTQGNAHLGWAVAGIGDVDGDGVPDYAAGAPDHDVSGFADAGRVLAWSGATGAALASLTVNGTRAGMRMGKAVAGAGDVTGDGRGDYLAGAPDYDLGGTIGVPDVGRFELHSGADGSLVLGSDGGSFALEGAALAGGEDLDDDGVPDFAVGAPGHGSGAGRVEVWSGRTLSVMFRVDGVGWEASGASLFLHRRTFLAGAPYALSNAGRVRRYDADIDWRLPGTFPSYGSSVAVVGDTDGDGIDDLVIGRYRHSGVTFSGSTWHIRSGRTSQIIYEETGPAPKGHTFCGLGDIDADGVQDFAVGNPGNDSVTIRSGAAPAAILRTITVPNAGAFGHALADAGDADGDGVSDLLVGDPDHFVPLGLGVTGRATLVSGATGTVLRHLPGSSPGEQAGWSVAGAGDVDGDGRDDCIVGAPGAPGAGFLVPGAARVHSGATGALLFSVPGDPAQSGHAGWSLCGPGDIDHDGFDDVAVGEPDWDDAAQSWPDRGRVRVVAGGPGPSHPVLLSRIGQYQDHRMGHALAPLGDVDRDGTPDLAMSRLFAGAGGGGGEVFAVSGLTGNDLRLADPPSSSPCSPYDSGEVLSGRRDPGPDGRNELLAGRPTLAGGGVCLYQLPAAISYPFGTGCGGNAGTPPHLDSSVPELGRLLTLSLSSIPAGSGPPLSYVSLPPPQNQILGFNCSIYLDFASLTPFVTFVPVSGFASFTLWIPDLPALAGARFHFQAVMSHAPSPFGFALTNGLELVLGF